MIDGAVRRNESGGHFISFMSQFRARLHFNKIKSRQTGLQINMSSTVSTILIVAHLVSRNEVKDRPRPGSLLRDVGLSVQRESIQNHHNSLVVGVRLRALRFYRMTHCTGHADAFEKRSQLKQSRTLIIKPVCESHVSPVCG